MPHIGDFGLGGLNEQLIETAAATMTTVNERTKTNLVELFLRYCCRAIMSNRTHFPVPRLASFRSGTSRHSCLTLPGRLCPVLSLGI